MSTDQNKFWLMAARLGAGTVTKGNLKITWIYRSGKFLCHFFVRGRLVEAAALSAAEFVICFMEAANWIVTNWKAGLKVLLGENNATA